MLSLPCSSAQPNADSFFADSSSPSFVLIALKLKALRHFKLNHRSCIPGLGYQDSDDLYDGIGALPPSVVSLASFSPDRDGLQSATGRWGDASSQTRDKSGKHGQTYMAHHAGQFFLLQPLRNLGPVHSQTKPFPADVYFLAVCGLTCDGTLTTGNHIQIINMHGK